MSRAVTDQRFADLYETFYPDVRSYCLRRIGYDELEDVVADVFLAAWRKIDDAPPGQGALYWLYRIAYHTIGNQWRTRSRRRRLGEKLRSVGGDQPDPSPEDYLVHDEESRIAIEAASRLRETDREVLMLSEWEQLSQPEIAEVLHLNANAVRQRLYRARQNLTSEFNKLAARNPTIPAAQEGGTR